MSVGTIKIAFYGKGGIGKSTIAANVSAALAAEGKRVLHIGCDPKSDSTRCLAQKKIPTVLAQMNRLNENLTREDIVFPGVFGVSCIEAGGPSAGTGCAGMGITAMEEELRRLCILEEGWDIVLYDVLGDVVCGGFAVPMRKHFVDHIYIVASSDFMALYAANNIMKGIRNCSGGKEEMFGGLILNHCRGQLDRNIAENFADRTGVSILAEVPESKEIKLADYGKKTVMEQYPGSEASQIFQKLARTLTEKNRKGLLPEPMEEEQLDEFCGRISELEGKGLA